MSSSSLLRAMATVNPVIPRPPQGWGGTTPVRRAAVVLSIALTFGLSTGILHWLLLLITHYVRHELVWYSRDFVWMAPITYALVLSPLAIGFVLLALAVPRI